MSSEDSGIREKRVARSWTPAGVLFFGAASLALLVGTNWIRVRLVATDMVRLDALVELQLSVATVHLWLEEYVTGDQVQIDSISDGLDRASYLLSTIVKGGSIDDIAIELDPLDDPALEAVANNVGSRLKSFAEISSVRQHGFETGEDVGIGSSLDVEYDRVFDALLAETRALEARIRSRLVDNSRLSQVLFRTILFSWVAIVAIAVTGLWTRERRRRRAVEALARSEAQLAQAQKMDAVGRLAGGITHDINNYLAAITANCELVLMQTEKDSPVARKMSAILSVVDKASSLIDRLLAFSRQQPAQVAVVNLNRVIQGLESMMRGLVGEDTRLELELNPDLGNTAIDTSQVEQILVNLLVNARQAMPTGGTVTIETDNVTLDESYTSTHATVMPGQYLLLAVTDTGPGIPEEIRDKIFEPFFTTKNKSQNSGLGLATVYGIVKQNRGHIWVYSDPGEGAIFKIYFPRVLAEAAQIREPIARLAPETGGNECILLVEDNEDFRKSALALLVAMGYRVLSARDAEEALRIYEGNRSQLDLVITDVVMPGMSGRELVDQIRARGDDVRVLFISGYTETVSHHGFADGQFNLLQKPFSADRLGRKIREVLAADARTLAGAERRASELPGG